jgi:hypothetical protein
MYLWRKDESMNDLIAFINRQIQWSYRTFGPGHRTKGVVQHIAKELKEVEADPLDLNEWVDVIILGIDGAWRTGASAKQIADALQAKQTKNANRSWPDWRTMSEDQVIEHDRSVEVS